MKPAELEKIQALLAKATATTFPEEAKAFMAKAQELMSKLRIDEGMAQQQQSKPDEVIDVRQPIKANVYQGPKLELLRIIAYRNNCLIVTSTGVDVLNVDVFGFKSDVEWTLKLFNLLLTQAKAELVDSANLDQMCEDYQNHCTSPIKWRNAFMNGFNSKIRDRLDQAKLRAEARAKRQYGAKPLAVVLADQEKAVRRRRDEVYPHLERGRGSKAGRSASGAAYGLGKQAAEKADIGAPKLKSLPLLIADHHP
jgi:hypothetical protein